MIGECLSPLCKVDKNNQNVTTNQMSRKLSNVHKIFSYLWTCPTSHH